jgi:hypothetical protein
MEPVPVIVTEEAAAQVAEWGLQRELEANLDWVRQNVPQLRGIRVQQLIGCVTQARDSVLILEAHREIVPESAKGQRIGWAWQRWAIKAFSRRTFERFLFDESFVAPSEKRQQTGLDDRPPVIVTEEAAAQVAEWGLQRELEANLDWVRQNVPQLRGIRVTRWTDLPKLARPPEIIVQAHMEFSPASLKGQPIEWTWLDWAVKALAFPVPFRCFRFHISFRPVTEE